MARAKKTPEQQANQVLEQAAPAAAQLLVELLAGEEATPSQKLDCAKEILNRALGKAGATTAKEQPPLVVTLAAENQEDAR